MSLEKDIEILLTNVLGEKFAKNSLALYQASGMDEQELLELTKKNLIKVLGISKTEDLIKNIHAKYSFLKE